MQGMIRALGGLVLLALAACASPAPPTATNPTTTALPPEMVLPPPPRGPVQCVPYARLVSGIALRGDAWTWWRQAEPRYARGRTPRPGAVLAFARTRALPRGHVSVVTRVVGAREILVTHANWGNTAATRGRVASGVRVIDTSPGNDWSELRVWNGDGFGRVYPAHGFIYPGAGGAGA